MAGGVTVFAGVDELPKVSLAVLAESLRAIMLCLHAGQEKVLINGEEVSRFRHRFLGHVCQQAGGVGGGARMWWADGVACKLGVQAPVEFHKAIFSTFRRNSIWLLTTHDVRLACVVQRDCEVSLLFLINVGVGEGTV